MLEPRRWEERFRRLENEDFPRVLEPRKVCGRPSEGKLEIKGEIKEKETKVNCERAR